MIQPEFFFKETETAFIQFRIFNIQFLFGRVYESGRPAWLCLSLSWCSLAGRPGGRSCMMRAWEETTPPSTPITSTRSITLNNQKKNKPFFVIQICISQMVLLFLLKIFFLMQKIIDCTIYVMVPVEGSLWSGRLIILATCWPD